MISYDRIIAEMDHQLAVARHANDERTMREALSAVRSLCEVALNEKGLTNSVSTPGKVVPKMVHTPEVQSLSSVEGKPLEESDANGGSLFEF